MTTFDLLELLEELSVKGRAIINSTFPGPYQNSKEDAYDLLSELVQTIASKAGFIPDVR